ncbi:ankyrin repeat domain-containing protein [Aurantiacibacter aquimixticola]|uniref:Ankyrin repeat domain-containing protein n=1 Tax=Aurantiacibacter aquimixticola TaxID=1958945 RepID=A0A419RX50_9SPHN|nr:ankyrin repeat domain-containing protein [Aurantiacibacter aquimixticola]RJY10375.1 ankyrin repeat domain-containing protein [Aurantiacibacter aquimixticola]
MFAIRKIFSTAAVVLGLSVSSPAAAQFYSDGYEFLEAVKNREGTAATNMLKEPGSTVVNSRDITSGETGLHIVVGRRDLTWTRWLLQEGANPNIADNDGRTPLILATEIGFLEGVEALLARGARVDVANRTGETPLIAAVHSRNTQLMEVLLEGGADPDRADNTGRSARDYARQSGVPPRILSTIESNERDDADGGDRVYGPVF